MARRNITSRVRVQGVGVVDGDTGFDRVAQGVGIVARNTADLAFSGLERVRVAQATNAARNAVLPRDEHGNITAPDRTAEHPFPSLYDATYDALLQKRFVNELGLQASEKFADYHNRAKKDPELFRQLADSYIQNVLEGVSDEAYETVRAQLQTWASQHYTQIANVRAKEEYDNAVALSEDILSRLVQDGYAASVAPGLDDETRAAQLDETRRLIAAELQFGSQPDIGIWSEAQANTVMDRAELAIRLGTAARLAQPIFDQADSASDVEMLVQAATESALESMDDEFIQLAGGEAQAREALVGAIALEAGKKKWDFAVRDMLEGQRFNAEHRRFQLTMQQAFRTGDWEPVIAYSILFDPASYHNVGLRDQALKMIEGGIATGQAMERMESTQDTQQQMIYQWDASGEGQQVRYYADKLGIPLTDGLELEFKPELLMNPEGLQTAIHQVDNLLRLLQKPADDGSGTDNEPLNHYQLMAAVQRQVAATRFDVDIDDIRKQALEGNLEAQLKLAQIQQVAGGSMHTHEWTKGQRKEMDQSFIADRIKQGFGIEGPVSHEITTQAFQFAMNQSPSVAMAMIRDFESMKGLSQSAMDFVQFTANDLLHGQGEITEHNVAGAMAAYAVLKQNPAAMMNSDLPAEATAAMENLWRAGYRGVPQPGAFRLTGGSINAATEVARRPFNVGDNKNKLSAYGIDLDNRDQVGQTSWVREQLRDKFTENMFNVGLDVAYGDELIPMAHDYVVIQAQKGVDPEDALNALFRSNFEQLGYGRSFMTEHPGRKNTKDGAIVFNAPALALHPSLASDRANMLPLERIAQQQLAQEFAHIPGVADQPERILLTSIERYDQYPYESASGLVQGTHYLATPMVINDLGMPQPLHDADGNLAIVSVNDLMERALRERNRRNVEFRQTVPYEALYP